MTVYSRHMKIKTEQKLMFEKLKFNSYLDVYEKNAIEINLFKKQQLYSLCYYTVVMILKLYFLAYFGIFVKLIF